MYGGYMAEPMYELLARIANFSPAIPSFSCGMTPQLAKQIVEKFGADVMITSGGYVHSHPLGVEAAVKEFREALCVPTVSKQ
jgi:ribulose 1,5-bisphosphate carboxylase large subunit-like protein